MTETIATVEALPIAAELGAMAELWAGDMWDRDQNSRSWLKPAGAWRSRAVYSDMIETTLVRVTTTSGAVGYGECHAPIASGVHAAVIDQLVAPILLGQDPMIIDHLWEKMYGAMRLRGYDSGFYLEAIAGADIALWDVKAQLLGLPIHRLIGGQSPQSLRVYHSHLPVLAPEALARAASALAADGYTAIQLGGGGGVARDTAAVAAVREAVGPDIQLMIDCAASYDLASATTLCRRLAEHDVWFVEDPLPPEHVAGYAALRAQSPVAIATGEALCTRYHFLELLKAGAVDVVLPDIGRAGGISETLKIAQLADAFQVAYSPHISVGSTVYIAASLHVAAAVPNLAIVEHWSGSHPLNDGLATAPPVLSDGHLSVPQAPGLGIEIDPEAVKRLRKVG